MNKFKKSIAYKNECSTGFDLGGLVAFLALTGVITSIIFVYSYLQLMGRSDLFIEVVSGESVTIYILALGALFGSLAFLVLVLPSYILITANDIAKSFIPKYKMSNFHLSLIISCGGVILAMMAIVLIATYTDTEWVLHILTSSLGIFCLALSYYWFKRKYFRPLIGIRDKLGWKNYGIYAMFFCLMMAFLIFSSSLYTYNVAKVVLELRSWEDDLSSVIKAFLLSIINMLATLIPASLFFISSKNNANMKRAAFSFGFLVFFFILAVSVPKVMGVAMYNVARVIGANDANAWTYIIIDNELRAVFSDEHWTNSYNAENNELTAKLLYGMGGVKVLCPQDTNIDIRDDNYIIEDAMKCALINSDKLVKTKK